MSHLLSKEKEFEGSKKELLELMWKISEEAWHSGWQTDLEFDLWAIISKGPTLYGHLLIDAATIFVLRELSIKTGGWIYFDDEKEETWIESEPWRRMFNMWKAKMDNGSGL